MTAFYVARGLSSVTERVGGQALPKTAPQIFLENWPKVVRLMPFRVRFSVRLFCVADEAGDLVVQQNQPPPNILS